MTVNTRVIKLFLRRQDLAYVPLKDGLHLQILPSISFLPTCQKHHFAAFIQDAGVLVVWDDEPKHLLVRAKHIEAQLMKMIWSEADDAPYDEKENKGGDVAVNEVPAEDGIDGEDLELRSSKPRKLVLIQAILCALTLIITIAAIGSGWRQIAIEVKVDMAMLRLAFILVVPLQIWLALVSYLECHSSISRTDRIIIVLHAVCHRQSCSDSRTYQSDERKLKILLWCSPSTNPDCCSASRHHPMPSLQGRSIRRYRAYHQIHQSCDLNL